MRELSMHILDLAQNSIAAGADRIYIEVCADSLTDRLVILITDNGRGIPSEIAANITDPFTTTRTTRRVGLGIPMMQQAAMSCDGDLKIETEPDVGTQVRATFRLSHIDRAPLGDMASTMVALIAANPNIDFTYSHKLDSAEFILDTTEIKAALDGVPINEPESLKWIAEYVRRGQSPIL